MSSLIFSFSFYILFYFLHSLFARVRTCDDCAKACRNSVVENARNFSRPQIVIVNVTQYFARVICDAKCSASASPDAIVESKRRDYDDAAICIFPAAAWLNGGISWSSTSRQLRSLADHRVSRESFVDNYTERGL